MTYKNEFNGIWASASLLHVAKNDMPKMLVKCYNALKPDEKWVNVIVGKI